MKKTLFPALSIGFALMLFFQSLLPAQNGFCYFDEALQQMLNNNPQMQQVLGYNEIQMQNMMNGDSQAIMNGVPYTIPVVFHVIHLGESVGIGSNISDTLLMQALNDLNNDFMNTLGTDTDIQFCLAKRAPDGSPSTGINRRNGYGVGNYETIGIAQGFNDLQIKDLSIWPNRDYLNIWVVHSIAGPGTTYGFATFPGTASAEDGIVLRASGVGNSNFSHIISHEAGHFLNLFHTFQGGTMTTCPPNSPNNCHNEGDRVCDTPPHKLIQGGCDSTGLNACDNNSSNALVAHNHMNYTDNTCRDRFTPEQVMRMRTALMALRPTLTYSLGCAPGCTTTVANFISPPPYIQSGLTLVFTNTSVNATSYSWLLDGHPISTALNLTQAFNDIGVFEVCLDATGSGCINRKRVVITVYKDCVPESDSCEKVINGNFEQLDANYTNQTQFEYLCGWDDTNSTPYFCDTPDNNWIGLWINANKPYGIKAEERITSRLPLNLTPNKRCRISFDYVVVNRSVASILVALTKKGPNIPSNGELPSDATIIAQVSSPQVDYSGYGTLPAVTNICLPENVEFHTYSGEFAYKNDGKLYLNVTGKSLTPFDSTNPSVVYIDNISINCCGSGTCVPAPNFTYEAHGCSVAFHGTNTGDAGDFFWDFGDNSPIETGQNATHNYLFGDTFNVCLTIQCPDLEHGKTICQQISIPDTCDHCSTLPLQTATRCDTTGSWMTNFCFPVPKGFKSCTGDQLSVYSPDALMTVTSYQIDDSNPLSDTLCIAIRLTPPPDSSFEQNGATGYITLCSNGEVPRICRMFEVEAQACDNCRPAIENTAICDDLILNDKLRIYRGVITLTINTLGAIFCGATSLEAGFAVGNVTSNGTTYTITYTVSTTNNGLNKFSALLCFSIGNQRWCFPVNITLPPCTELPQDCAMNWSVKNMACAGVEGNNLVFNFAMSVNVGNWVICANGLFGTVDHGIVEVIQNPALLGGVLTFNVNMVIPCDSFVSGNVYNMRLYLCTEEGNLVCLFFPFRLFCQDCAEIGNRARAAVNKKDRAMGQYLIIPNPATDRISILIQDFDPEMQQEARLLNHTGSLVKSAYLSSDKTEIDLSQCYPGVYYVIISNNGALVRSEKVIIMR